MPEGPRPDALPVRLPFTDKAFAELHRIHRARHDPLWWGPAPGDPHRNRFDDPEGEFRVLYAGVDEAAAFCETFLHDHPGLRVLSLSECEDRRVSRLHCAPDLRLVQLFGAGLKKLGADSSVSAGPHRISRLWARALWEHPDQPDGIAYRPRTDNDLIAVAVFDRAAAWTSEAASSTSTRLAASSTRRPTSTHTG